MSTVTRKPRKPKPRTETPQPRTEPETTQPQPEPTPKKAPKKAKPEPTIFTPAELAPLGELWTRTTNFDHAHIQAEAWVLITTQSRGKGKPADHTAYSWMTYDRALGKSDPMGRPSEVKDPIAYVHKLMKKGYAVWTPGTE